MAEYESAADVVEDCVRLGSFFPDDRDLKASHVRHVYASDERVYVLTDDLPPADIEMTAPRGSETEFGNGLNVHPEKKACQKAGTIDWDFENPTFDPDGVVVTGECIDCGAILKAFYEKTSILDPDANELITEF